MKRDSRKQPWPILAVIALIPFAGSSIAVAESSDEGTDAAQVDEIIVRATHGHNKDARIQKLNGRSSCDARRPEFV